MSSHHKTLCYCRLRTMGYHGYTWCGLEKSRSHGDDTWLHSTNVWWRNFSGFSICETNNSGWSWGRQRCARGSDQIGIAPTSTPERDIRSFTSSSPVVLSAGVVNEGTNSIVLWNCTRYFRSVCLIGVSRSILDRFFFISVFRRIVLTFPRGSRPGEPGKDDYARQALCSFW